MEGINEAAPTVAGGSILDVDHDAKSEMPGQNLPLPRVTELAREKRDEEYVSNGGLWVYNRWRPGGENGNPGILANTMRKVIYKIAQPDGKAYVKGVMP